MAAILNIETATSLCSVALARDGRVVVQREVREEKAHAAQLTAFIADILKEKSLKISDLDAIAVGRGPGSYTGLRIGISVAKGLCYGSNLPLIAVGTLDVIFRQVLNTADPLVKDTLKSDHVLVCPMIDARRMEVFTCLFTNKGECMADVSATIIDSNSFSAYYPGHTILFAGSGMEKCRQVLAHPQAVFVPDIFPHAAALAMLAEESYKRKEFENLAYFEPFYLKDFIATTPKKSVAG
jgi:tRNA threonylcarbamoyladenosine biosynthesis protein TsaB